MSLHHPSDPLNEKLDLSTHGGEVINLLDSTSRGQQAVLVTSEVENVKFVCLGRLVLGDLDVRTPHPMSIRFELFHKMVTNKATGSGY
jgi:hypothetical protein